MRRWIAYLAAIAIGLSAAQAADDATWAPLAAMVDAQIAAGKLPGAVLIVGNEDGVEYRRAFGVRSLSPSPEPMTEDTIFDLASLTKAVATTTAILQLLEQHRLALDEPVARIWPAFGAHDKAVITVRQLLAHTTGLPADLDLRHHWRGQAGALRQIEALPLQSNPGQQMLYSDVNFEVLGEVVHRVSGQTLDQYCREHVFGPLGMRDTGFRPGRDLRARIAPTSVGRGVVHDPSAARMDGVSGHAGLFGTADDLARFARAMLRGGELDGARILQAGTVAELARPASPTDQAGWRGLGWQLIAPLVANRDSLPPVGAYGHLGYTGTGLWIDPITKRFVVLLSNRVYPDEHGDVAPLRREVLAMVANRQAPISPESLAALTPELATDFALPRVVRPERRLRIQAGIDLLEAEDFAPLQGLKVGLITNLAGVDGHGRRTIDALRWAPGVTLAAIFTPEHGLYAQEEGKVPSGVEPVSGLPLYSLYGAHQRPSEAETVGLDALVVDLQDAGARFYTYVTTMAYAMETAAARHLPIYILDRPDPIAANHVEGPMLDGDLRSFTAYFPLPVQPGMTMGEMAQLFNVENHIGADLHIVTLGRYQRDQWYDQTGLDWIPPSPNLRTLAAATLYPGVSLVEGSDVSVGRGTDRPFQLLGAPWINGKTLAAYLNARNIPGVHFVATEFTPIASNYRNRLCHGVRIDLQDRDALRAPRLGIELAAALQHFYAHRFDLDRTTGMIGSRAVVQAIHDGVDPAKIEAQWQPAVSAFMQLRSRYLLY